MGADVQQLAQLTALAPLGNRGVHQFVPGVVTLHVAHHETCATSALCLQDAVRLSERDRHRLFHEDVLAGKQTIARDLTLQRERGGDSDGVYLAIGSHLLVGGIELWYVMRRWHRWPRSAHLGEGNQFTVGSGGEVGEMDSLGQIAGADVAEPDGPIKRH